MRVRKKKTPKHLSGRLGRAHARIYITWTDRIVKEMYQSPRVLRWVIKNNYKGMGKYAEKALAK